MEVSFWGVRGTSPAVDREQWRYGGHTPCVAVRAPDDTLIILDAGTGLRELSRQWLSPPAGAGLRLHLLLSHYHWDHIQGLPYFEPLYTYGNRVEIYGPRPQSRQGQSLQEVLEQLVQPPYFAQGPEAWHAQRGYREVGEESWEVGGVRVTARRLNHPQGSMGYRLEAGGGVVVYASDHEAGFPAFDRGLRELAWEADVLIADAHYWPEEVGLRYRGLGHSSWREAVKVAREGRVKRLVLFHHAPSRRDGEIDEMVSRAREEFGGVWGAAEQMEWRLAGGEVEMRSRGRRLSQRSGVGRTVILEGEEGGLPFAEEAWLANVGVQGAYVHSRHRLAVQARVRVVVEGEGVTVGPGSRVQWEGRVVRVDPLSSLPSASEAPARKAGETRLGAPQRFGVAIHFPGLTER